MRRHFILTTVILAAVLSFSACSSSNKVKSDDLNFYLKDAVSFGGAEGYGRIEFEDNNLVLERIIFFLGDKDDQTAARVDLAGHFSLKAKDENKNLKNGDTVSVVLDYDEEVFEQHGIELKNKSGDEFEVEVSGLPEAEAFDPFEKVSMSASGYNGYGKLKGTLDTNGAEYFFSVNDDVLYKIDKDENLKNGDKVTITAIAYNDNDDEITGDALVDYCIEKFNRVPTRTSMEIEVKDLKDADTIDLFSDDYMEISVSGINGSGDISIKSKKEGLDYYALQDDDIIWDSSLSNGDELTIVVCNTVSGFYDDDNDEKVTDFCLENFGGVPEKISMSYTVKGLSTYATKVDEISSEAMNKMKNVADDIRTEEFSSGKKESLISSDYIGAYLLSNKNLYSNVLFGGDHNKLYLVFKNKVSNPDGEFTYYWYICYTNIVIKGDGTTADVDSNYYTYPVTQNKGCLKTKSGYYYPGYETLDKFKEYVINSQSDTYDCDSTVKD